MASPTTTTSSDVPVIKLNDRRSIPQLGFGTYLIPDEELDVLLADAFAAGYRAVDTARIYGNEEGVGRAIAAADLPRDAFHITTKLWNDDQGYGQTIRAFEASCNRLGVDWLDMYLMHWPAPSRNTYVDTWRAFVQLKMDRLSRSIGVSNFQIEHLDRIIDDSGVVPAVNQIELHPYFQQAQLREYHQEQGIVTQSWSPLGQGGELLTDPVIVAIAERLGRTPAQVVLRWHLQLGLVVIPKTATASRVVENFDVFSFDLTAEDMAAIESLDRGADGRIGPNPDTATF